MGKTKESPRKEFLHYTSRGDLQGIRQGSWKLLVKNQRGRRNQNRNAPTNSGQVLLFDLSKDLGEQNNLADQHPDLVKKLRQRMEALDKEITANARAPWTQG